MNERFVLLLSKRLSSEINGEEFNEFNQLLTADEFNRVQYELFKDFWEQQDQRYACGNLVFNKIKSRIGIDIKPQ